MPPPSLEQIPSLSTEHAGLLRACGISDAAVLSTCDADELRLKLEYAGWQAGLRHRVPSVEAIRGWIVASEMLLEAGQDAALPSPAINGVREAYVAPKRPPAPPAGTPAGAWTPPGLRVAKEVAGVEPAADMESMAQQSAEADTRVWRKVNPSKFRTIEDYNEKPAEPLLRVAAETGQPVNIPERAIPRISGSESKAPSRFVVRGVVHPMGTAVWIGALLSILWRLGLLATLIWIPFFFMKEDLQTNLAQHRMEALCVLGGLALLGVGQLWAMKLRCRVCSCHLYYSRRTIKNKKSHNIPGTGKVFSLSLHLLIFRWFRCMYCGTAIRLSERKRDEDEE